MEQIDVSIKTQSSIARLHDHNIQIKIAKSFRVAYATRQLGDIFYKYPNGCNADSKLKSSNSYFSRRCFQRQVFSSLSLQTNLKYLHLSSFYSCFNNDVVGWSWARPGRKYFFPSHVAAAFLVGPTIAGYGLVLGFWLGLGLG